MSKKMKRGALESSNYVMLEDNKVRLKHQTLLQDYQELHKETNDTRDKLEDAKMRKQRLLAEVHFLRRRHKYLLQMKSSSHPEQQERTALPNSEFYCENGMKDRFPSKKEAKLHKLPPLPVPKQKVRIQVAKEASSQKTLPDFLVNHKQALHIGKDVPRSTVLSLKHKSRAYSGKEVLFRKAAPAFDLNQNGRSFAGNVLVSRSTTPFFDLNHETGHVGKDVVLPSRAPVIDLNEISIGEEELQANFQPLNFEEPNRRLIQNTNDDQHRDLKLSICRNVGEGTSRVEKRKISWQDPVALRV